MQYKVIRWVFFINAFYVVILLLRQILQIDTISPILVLSQVELLVLIAFGANTLRFKREELFLLFLVCIALLKSDFDFYHLNNILIDFAKPALFIAAVASIRSRGISAALTDKRLEKIFRLYAITTVVSVCIGLYYFSFIASIYPAYSSVYSLLGYFYLLRRSRYLSSGFLILLALSGKRAVILSGVFTQVISRRYFYWKFSWLIIFIIVSIFLFFVLDQIGWNWIAINILKLNLDLLGATTDNVELLIYITGGRMDELLDGLSYDFNVENILFGKSLGYTYESLAFEELEHKNFHFTPASLFVNYGLIFMVLFIRYIFRIIFDKDVRACAEKYGNIYVIRMYMIGALFFFSTEYGVFGYINFCIGLGLLAGGKSVGRETGVASARPRYATT